MNNILGFALGDRQITPQKLKQATETIRYQYAKAVALTEIELASMETQYRNRQHQKIRDWVMSTLNRRTFMLHGIVANFMGHHVSTTAVRKSLGISRAALDSMVRECEEANWMTVQRNSQGHRSIQATDPVMECWLMYVDRVNMSVYKHELDTLCSSMQYMRMEKSRLETNK